MKVCLIGMLIMICQWVTAQVDSLTSNYIYKLFFQNHLAQVTVIDSPTVKERTDTNIRICTPSKSKLLNTPLCVIKSNHQIFTLTESAATKSIKPSWVKQLDILIDREMGIKQYGEAAKNGVIIITIDNEKYPNAFKSIKTNSIKK